jgi:hypothetical protein
MALGHRPRLLIRQTRSYVDREARTAP